MQSAYAHELLPLSHEVVCTRCHQGSKSEDVFHIISRSRLLEEDTVQCFHVDAPLDLSFVHELDDLQLTTLEASGRLLTATAGLHRHPWYPW